MSLDTKMIPIHPYFTIKDGKMDHWIALLEEILVMKKFKKPDWLVFSITKFESDKAFVSEAVNHLNNMGHMIPKCRYRDLHLEIESFKAILPDADFYEAISGF